MNPLRPRFYLLTAALAGLLLTWPPDLLAEASTHERLTFLNLSDLHFAAEGEPALDGFNLSRSIGDQLRALVGDFNSDETLDFVVLTGDLVADSPETNLREVRKILDGMRVPYYVVPGNHDVPTRKSHDAGGKTGSASFSDVFEGRGPQGGRSFWSVDPKKGWHLVGLDSTICGTWRGRIGVEQLRWLEQDLLENVGKRTIVLSHHGLIAHHPWDGQGSWKGYMAENADEVRGILERYRDVILVVTGHHHWCAHRSWNGIEYISSPALASWPCRYGCFAINGDRLEFSTHPIPSSTLVEKAKQNLLNYKPIRGLFPAGPEQEKLFLNLFLGPERLSLDLYPTRESTPGKKGP